MSRIYICHQYGGKEENKQHIEKIIKALIKQETSLNTYISPVHTFGFLYNDVDYKQGITYCLELLKTCDVMYMFFNGNDDYSKSNGCLIEYQFAKDNHIPIVTILISDVNKDDFKILGTKTWYLEHSNLKILSSFNPDVDKQEYGKKVKSLKENKITFSDFI